MAPIYIARRRCRTAQRNLPSRALHRPWMIPDNGLNVGCTSRPAGLTAEPQISPSTTAPRLTTKPSERKATLVPSSNQRHVTKRWGRACDSRCLARGAEYR